MRNKKAVSPVIATVLLVMIVIVLAIIILLWSRGFIKEVVLKEIGGESKRVEQFCSEIGMISILNSDGSFGFTNNGNIPIYSFNLKLEQGGSSQIVEIGLEEGGLVNPGFSALAKDDGGNLYDYYDYDSVKIIPILLGKTKTGAIKEKTCDEVYGLVV